MNPRRTHNPHVARHHTFILLALLAIGSAWAYPTPQSDQDALFNQAVAAYNQNQFSQAQQLFQRVTGSHAQEAGQYVSKMKSYRDAMEVAKSAMDRSPDEQDANNLAFAIQQIQKAIAIKPDGPWNPADQLAKARNMKAAIENAHAAASKAMASDFCAKALAASQEHHYKEAARLSCAIAYDNPGYSCGGDEAVHLCQMNTDLAKLDKSPAPTGPVTRTTPAPEPASHSDALDKAKAAYDNNDFTRARNLLQRVDPGSQAAANDYLDKISRYTDAISNAEKLGRSGQYDQAHAAYLSAVAIKPNGPGDPQTNASRMELFLGLDQFYSGDYATAVQHLQSVAHAGLQKQPLVYFYLGASELGRYFVTGNEDSMLHDQALADLKQAKQAGFKTTGQDISPKILQVYKDLSF